jgi:hypothetical protein
MVLQGRQDLRDLQGQQVLTALKDRKDLQGRFTLE